MQSEPPTRAFEVIGPWVFIFPETMIFRVQTKNRTKKKEIAFAVFFKILASASVFLKTKFTDVSRIDLAEGGVRRSILASLPLKRVSSLECTCAGTVMIT